MDRAELERAVTGVFRSAFGMNGHKCSACSRVYVHRNVADEFMSRLVRRTEEARIGDPLERGVFLGPVATKNSLADFERFTEIARREGVIRTGGERLSGDAYAHGYFVRPTIVTGLPQDHELMRQ